MLFSLSPISFIIEILLSIASFIKTESSECVGYIYLPSASKAPILEHRIGDPKSFTYLTLETDCNLFDNGYGEIIINSNDSLVESINVIPILGPYARH